VGRFSVRLGAYWVGMTPRPHNRGAFSNRSAHKHRKIFEKLSRLFQESRRLADLAGRSAHLVMLNGRLSRHTSWSMATALPDVTLSEWRIYCLSRALPLSPAHAVPPRGDPLEREWSGVTGGDGRPLLC